MDPETLDLIQRSHAVFGDPPAQPAIQGGDVSSHDQLLVRNADLHSGGGHREYTQELTNSRTYLRESSEQDVAVRKILAQIAADHAAGHRTTRAVLDAAHADQAASVGDSPIDQRELIARKANYLRRQQSAIRDAHHNARRSAAALRLLRYRRPGRHHLSAEQLRHLPNTRGGRALKAALTQLGVNYVWGGTAPGKGLDCSGLTQYAWRQAGVHLDRTTWAQIHQGIAVHRHEIQPGDLVFPAHSGGGHVQMYAGGGKVIEAPYSGAKVRISALPQQIMAIRRPM